MSESFLSQEEVDALLEGVTGESQKLVEEVHEQGDVRTYNISSQERIVRGRMPTMEVVNERFARNLRVGLFNFIRRSPEISVGPVSVQRYSAFLRELAVPTNFNIVDKRGAYFRYNDMLLGQGRENAKVFLAENPTILLELERRIRGESHITAVPAEAGAADGETSGENEF